MKTFSIGTAIIVLTTIIFIALILIGVKFFLPLMIVMLAAVCAGFVMQLVGAFKEKAKIDAAGRRLRLDQLFDKTKNKKP